MTTIALLSDEQWAVLEPLLPPVKGAMGRPMRSHRPVVEGAIYRAEVRGAVAVHARAVRGVADRAPAPPAVVVGRDLGRVLAVLAVLQADADARGELDWSVSVDSTIARVHQHGATAARSVSGPSSYTGGTVE